MNHMEQERDSILKKASAKTGAGILIVSYYEDKWRVLLGNRRVGRDPGTWSNLGGLSDPKDKTLNETAAREICEESNGLIYICPDKLLQYPAHTLINGGGQVNEYRMYIAPHPYVDPNNLLKSQKEDHNKEYDDFTWVNLEDLLASIENNNPFFENFDKKIELFSPLLKMLSEDSVKNQLKKLSKSDFFSLPAQVTVSKKNCLTSPNKEEEIAQTVVRHGNVMAELKSQIKEKEKKSTVLSKIPLEERATYKLLKVQFSYHNSTVDISELSKNFKPRDENGLLNMEYWVPYFEVQHNTKTKDDQEKLLKKRNVKEILSILDPKNIELLADSNFLQLLQDVWENETSYPDYIPFYHACEPEIGCLFDFITEVRNQLRVERSSDIRLLRALDDAFEGLSNVTEHLDRTRKEQGEYDKYRFDYVGEARTRQIAANISIFGSIGVDISYEKRSFNSYDIKKQLKKQLSNSYDIFYRTENAWLLDIKNIIEQFFNKLGVSVDSNRYTGLSDEFFKHNSRLLQIFIHKSAIDDLVYLADSGKGCPLSKEHKKYPLKIENNIGLAIADLDWVLDYCSDPNMLSARIFLKPSSFLDETKVIIKSYSKFPISDRETNAYKKQLRYLVNQDLKKCLTSRICDLKFENENPKEGKEWKKQQEELNDRYCEIPLLRLHQTVMEQYSKENYKLIYPYLNVIDVAVDRNDKFLFENENPKKLQQEEPNDRYREISVQRLHQIAMEQYSKKNDPSIPLFLEAISSNDSLILTTYLKEYKVDFLSIVEIQQTKDESSRYLNVIDVAVDRGYDKSLNVLLNEELPYFYIIKTIGKAHNAKQEIFEILFQKWNVNEQALIPKLDEFKSEIYYRKDRSDYLTLGKLVYNIEFIKALNHHCSKKVDFGKIFYKFYPIKASFKPSQELVDLLASIWNQRKENIRNLSKQNLLSKFCKLCENFKLIKDKYPYEWSQEYKRVIEDTANTTTFYSYHEESQFNSYWNNYYYPLKMRSKRYQRYERFHTFLF